MGWVNVGVHEPHNASKAALKQAVKEDPSAVMLYTTALFGPQFRWKKVSELDPGEYSAVGPIPDRVRKWYATIKVGPDGAIKVS